jgi:tetratricopeptide (TPR) repeat protein
MSNNSAGLFTLTNSSYLGDCPICFLPLPLDMSKSGLMGCCSQLICLGCDYSNKMQEIKEDKEHKCPFCREPLVKSDKEEHKRLMKRVKKNDRVAIREEGKRRRNEGDYKTALRYLTKAAGLGDAAAHFELAFLYHNGRGVVKDEKKEVYHSEKAAIGGHPKARHNLGIEEANNGRFGRAVKHFIIAAYLGDDKSLKVIKDLYAEGHASKEDYAVALYAYQAAVDATKSKEREDGEAFYKLEATRGNVSKEDYDAALSDFVRTRVLGCGKKKR